MSAIGSTINRFRHFRRGKITRSEAYHFLHIGKAAGTEIKRLAELYPEEIICHEHDTSLKDLPRDVRYFFSIRDPISRFYSGFYSRKRKGAPRYNFPWSACEEAAFGDFEHANDLAEALFEEDKSGIKAAQAMISIRHTGQNLVSWFFLQANLFEVRPPVWIIRQENFEADLKEFLRRANLERPESAIVSQSHANNYDETPPLTDKAKQNLRRWYAQDYAFYRVCEVWLENREG